MIMSPKIALITTTIYVPKVLKLYRSFGADIAFYIAGDKKTPHDEVRAFLKDVPNAFYYSPEQQEAAGYESSPIIGWNKIMRRNFALLEAIKSGADIIVTIDDDNLPADPNYFEDFRKLFAASFSGLGVTSKIGWYDIGHTATPKIYHRGFPYPKRHIDLGVGMQSITDGKIGLAAGLWYGDPDIDAMQRITNAPMVYEFNSLINYGVFVPPGTWTVFNSQNTAFLRKFAPLMMVLCGVGRYDDIWAAYITQRIMQAHGYGVHFGKPFVWQERNLQNLWTNLKDEMLGMEKTTQFVTDLEAIDIGDGTPVQQLRKIYYGLAGKDYLPGVVCELGHAWCNDIEKILR